MRRKDETENMRSMSYCVQLHSKEERFMLACEYVAFHSCLITKFKTSPFFFTMPSPPSLAHGFADTALPASSQVW